LAKVGDWLDAGARLVWVSIRNAASRESTAQTERSSCWRDDQLLGEDVLPGFSCTLASILGM